MGLIVKLTNIWILQSNVEALRNTYDIKFLYNAIMKNLQDTCVSYVEKC